MPRLIVAPVGHQPAAVLAPLLSEPVRPGPDDLVVLIAGDHTTAEGGTSSQASRVALALNGRSIEYKTLALKQAGVADWVRERMDELAEGREVWLVLNGGPWVWSRSLLDHLYDRSPTLVWSRDGKGQLFDSDGKEQAGGKFDVGNFADDEGRRALLLGTLQVLYDEDGQRLVLEDDELAGVVALVEKSGLLFAALDVERWGAGAPDEKAAKARRLREYRSLLLVRRRLQRFGLEPRRLLLTGVRTGSRLEERIRQDAVPIAGTDFGVDDWKQKVADGEAMRISEAQQAGGGDSASVAPYGVGASWNGGRLAVPIGTVPTTTLRAVWSHQPGELLLWFDGSEPQSVRLANRLRDVLRKRCSVQLQDLEESSAPAGWSTDGTEVNVTPGDKRAKVKLEALVRNGDLSGRIWFLDSEGVRSAEGAQVRKGEPVPLEIWARMHAPTAVAFETTPVDPRLTRMANALFKWLSRPSNRGRRLRLSKLWKRRDRPCLSKDQRKLKWLGGRDYKVGSFDGAIAGSFVEPSDHKPNGRWFEWIVAAKLQAEVVGLELRIGLRALWPDQDLSDDWQRDELDVVTRLDHSYAYWSCKAYWPKKDAEEHLAEARAQANRFLGQRSTAVLVVPAVSGPGDGFRMSGAPGHWYHPTWDAHLVDARLFRAREALTALAAGR